MLIKIGAGLLAAVLALMSAGVLFLIQGGLATVYVHDEDLSLYLPVPVAGVELALLFLPDEELSEIRREIEPVRELVASALQELARTPDIVFVEIRSRDEEVLIQKDGDDFVVSVHRFGGEEVEVKIPFRSVGRIFGILVGSGTSASGPNS